MSTCLWADNEETMYYDWAYGSDGSVVGVKVTGAGSASGDVVVPETHWDWPVVEIGENAFKSNSSIHSVTLPNSVVTIGASAFWSCSSLQAASLGNSLATIGDNAFQYCNSLQSITLPNTLTAVGDHFLCSCKSLTTLVIPENLTSIGSYFLHGCENIRTVCLLGSKQRTLGEYPFVSQRQQGLNQVTGCTFYVDNETVYETLYKNADNWKYADAANTDYIGDDGYYQNGGNSYQWTSRPDDIRPYEAQWITACYPTDVDARLAFGDNALVARMTDAQYKGQDSEGNYLYHLDFTLVDDKKMKAHHPYLLKVDPKNVGSAYIVQHSNDESMKTDEDLSVVTDISNQSADPSANRTSIKMLGTYASGGRNLQPGEFLFSNTGGNLKFYKQTAGGRQRHMGAYRCYWQIVKDDTPVSNAKLGNFDFEATGIRTEVYVHHPGGTEIFTLQGQPVWRHGDDVQGLPTGIYIVKGKKVIVK